MLIDQTLHAKVVGNEVTFTDEPTGGDCSETGSRYLVVVKTGMVTVTADQWFSKDGIMGVTFTHVEDLQTAVLLVHKMAEALARLAES